LMLRLMRDAGSISALRCSMVFAFVQVDGLEGPNTRLRRNFV
jgi:hypothetical protein